MVNETEHKELYERVTKLEIAQAHMETNLGWMRALLVMSVVISSASLSVNLYGAWVGGVP